MTSKYRGRKRILPKIRLSPDIVLRTICDEVEGDEVMSDEVSTIIRDMRHILINSVNGVGLAANQAGYTKRIIMVNDPVGGLIAMINPKITDHGDDKSTWEEGCLSYPGAKKDVARWDDISVSFYEINDKGVLEFWENEICKGMYARIVQHEIDHLNGTCKVGM